MKTLFFRLRVLIFCVPVYFLSMFGEYYIHQTSSLGKKKFDIKEFSKWYWADVKEALKVVVK